ncbi:MAG: Rne/Rng family ribonuclease [Zavarzinella sp.]
MKKEMLINVLQPEECRIAMIEDGVLQELYVERASQESFVNNIYKGKIINIEPSIQAAFVDFGVGRNGFLHVSDVAVAYFQHLLEQRAPRPAQDRDPRRSDDRRNDGPRPPRSFEPVVVAPESTSGVGGAKIGSYEVGDDFDEGILTPEPAPVVAAPKVVAPPVQPAPAPVPQSFDLSDFDDGIGLEEAETEATDTTEEPETKPKKTKTSSTKAKTSKTPAKKGATKKTASSKAKEAVPAPEAPAATEEEKPKPKRKRVSKKADDSVPAPSAEHRTDSDDDFFFDPTAPNDRFADLPAPAPKVELPDDDDLEFDLKPEPASTDKRIPSIYDDQDLEDMDFYPPPVPKQPGDQRDSGNRDRGARDHGRPDRGDRDFRDRDHDRGGRGGRDDRGDRDRGRSDREERGDRDRSQSDRGDREDRGDRDRGGRGDREDRGDRDRGGRGDREDRGDRGNQRGGQRQGGPRDNSPKPPPIEQIFKKGQEVIVQVIKEGMGTKGPTLSTQIAIAGRYLVLAPWMQRVAVSKKIEDDRTRFKLKDLLRELDPPEGIGFIVRTAAADRDVQELKSDLAYLTRLWEVFCNRANKRTGPFEIYRESDMIIRTIRDIFTSDIDTIWIDDPEAFAEAQEFMKIVMPRYADRLKLHDSAEPIFHRFQIDDEVNKLRNKKVPLPGGGSIVIEQTEALVAIDVNSGNFRVDNDAEETAFQTNLQAAKEIARQLRLRNLGGVIINDFIDMREERHRRQVEETLRRAMSRDRSRTKILKTSAFGIIEMTRQRVQTSLQKSATQDCNHCNGLGNVKTPESMSIEVIRRIQLAASRKQARTLEINVHADVAHHLQNKKRRDLTHWEEVGQMQVSISGRTGVSPELCEIRGFDNNGVEVPVQPTVPQQKNPERRDQRRDDRPRQDRGGNGGQQDFRKGGHDKRKGNGGGGNRNSGGGNRHQQGGGNRRN